MAITPGFQPGDDGSIPFTRSKISAEILELGSPAGDPLSFSVHTSENIFVSEFGARLARHAHRAGEAARFF